MFASAAPFDCRYEYYDLSFKISVWVIASNSMNMNSACRLFYLFWKPCPSALRVLCCIVPIALSFVGRYIFDSFLVCSGDCIAEPARLKKWFFVGCYFLSGDAIVINIVQARNQKTGLLAPPVSTRHHLTGVRMLLIKLRRSVCRPP